MPKVSVIIPVYNAENYIDQCVRSVLAQTFTDFELLLIDDGSTDGSGIICDNFVQKDTRIKVFHKANSGVSSARNQGLESAMGEWIVFLDSDDVIEAQYLEHLLLNVLSFHSDFATSRLIEARKTKEYENRTYENLDGFKTFFENCDYHPIGGKIFNKSILDAKNIRFHQDIKQGEDTLFIKEYILHCKRVSTTSYRGYCYRESNTATKCFPLQNSLERIKLDKELDQKYFELHQKQLIKPFVNDRLSIIDYAILACLKFSTKNNFKHNIRQFDIDFYVAHTKAGSWRHKILLGLLKHQYFAFYRYLMLNHFKL